MLTILGFLNRDGNSVTETSTSTANGFGFSTRQSIGSSAACLFVRIVALSQAMVTDWIDVGTHSVTVSSVSFS